MKTHKGIFNILEQKIPFIIDFLTSKKMSWTIIAIGTILRVAQFLFNRSLTEGEAPVAMNIIYRSYSELLKPLDYIQPAPVGFSVIEKIFVEIFGNSEYALRLFPLIAGIIALYLFYKIAQKFISQEALPIALILFAICDHIIYFSSEVKQYSSDVAITLFLILITYYVLNRKLTSTRLILVGIIGAVSCWFSHPAVFIFFGVTIVLFISIVQKREWKNLVWLFIAVIIASASLGINYVMSLEILSKNQGLLEGFQNSFMPLPPDSLADIQWFGYVFLRMFKNPLGLSIYELLLAVLSFFVGVVVMSHKKRKILLILVLPILLTLFASGMKKYPFEGRLLLFSAPLMILIIAEGINFIRIKASQGSTIVGITLVGILLFHPVILAGYHLIKPRAPEELRPVVEYLKEHHKEGDITYLYYATVKAFRYYADRLDFFENDYIVSVESRHDWSNYYKDLVILKGNKRVWILFSHVIKWYGVDEEKLFLSYLDIFGSRLDEFRASGASIYLYDLSNQTDNNKLIP